MCRRLHTTELTRKSAVTDPDHLGRPHRSATWSWKMPPRINPTITTTKMTFVTRTTVGLRVSGVASLGFVEAALAAPGTEIMAVVRGRETPVVTAALPLLPHRYIRG